MGLRVKSITDHVMDFPVMADDLDTITVLHRLPYGVMVFERDSDENSVVVHFNEKAAALFSLEQSARLPASLSSLWPSGDYFLLQTSIRDAFRSRCAGRLEWNLQLGGIQRHLNCELIFSAPRNPGDSDVVICTFIDNTAEKVAEQNLLHHAFHDALTGLPNRVLFRSRLEEAVSDCRQDRSGETNCAIMVINIDRFQQINESFGHSAGDRFLVSISTTLRRCIRSVDTLARLSGDEFAILVTSCRDLAELELVAERIHGAMKSPYDLEGNEIFSSVSIGISTTLEYRSHPEDLIRYADLAMHKAKALGMASTHVYQNELHSSGRNQFHLETELRRAIERDGLELYYQPIIDFRSGKLRAFEALTRWIHPDRGFVSPAEFIPLAEETGMIVDLGRWAMLTASHQVAEWLKLTKDPGAVKVNVNVSGIQFARDDVALVVEEALKLADIKGENLRVELTESAIMSNPMQVSETLAKIRKMGVGVALDDFGTGYCSLNYLHQFPIDILKIDRAFINQVSADETQYKILKIIGMLGSTLDLGVVAEGIETIDQVQMLSELEIQYAQGFYFSKPVPVAEATALLLDDKRNWLK